MQSKSVDWKGTTALLELESEEGTYGTDILTMI